MNKQDKADDVVAAMEGPPLYDASGRIIKDGDWIVQSAQAGQSAVLRYGRIWPHRNRGCATAFSVNMELNTYHSLVLIKGSITLTDRVAVAPCSMMPETIRNVMGGKSFNELNAIYLADQKLGKRERRMRFAPAGLEFDERGYIIRR